MTPEERLAHNRGYSKGYDAGRRARPIAPVRAAPTTGRHDVLYLDHSAGVCILVEVLHPASGLERLIAAGGPRADDWNRVIHQARLTASYQRPEESFAPPPVDRINLRA